jgi:hypothetical protein
VQNLVQHWGWDVLAFLPTLHVIIGCLHVWENIFGITVWIGRDINTSVTASTLSEKGWIQICSWSFTK